MIWLDHQISMKNVRVEKSYWTHSRQKEGMRRHWREGLMRLEADRIILSNPVGGVRRDSIPGEVVRRWCDCSLLCPSISRFIYCLHTQWSPSYQITRPDRFIWWSDPIHGWSTDNFRPADLQIPSSQSIYLQTNL